MTFPLALVVLGMLAFVAFVLWLHHDARETGAISDFVDEVASVRVDVANVRDETVGRLKRIEDGIAAMGLSKDMGL
jgi:cyanate permease